MEMLFKWNLWNCIFLWSLHIHSGSDDFYPFSEWLESLKKTAIFSSFECESLSIWLFLFVSSKPATQAACVTVMYGQFKTYIFYACILYFVAFTRAKHFRKEKSLCIYHYFCVVLHWMFYAFFPFSPSICTMVLFCNAWHNIEKSYDSTMIDVT